MSVSGTQIYYVNNFNKTAGIKHYPIPIYSIFTKGYFENPRKLQ